MKIIQVEWEDARPIGFHPPKIKKTVGYHVEEKSNDEYVVLSFHGDLDVVDLQIPKDQLISITELQWIEEPDA